MLKIAGYFSHQGLCIDLLKELAERIGFNYTIYLVEDGNFGVKDKSTNQWNGMVRDLVERVSETAYYTLLGIKWLT